MTEENKEQEQCTIQNVMSSSITIQKHFSNKRITLYADSIEDCVSKRKKYYPSWYQVVFEPRD